MGGLDTDTHIIFNEGRGVGVRDVGVEVGVGVVDGIVSLEQNDEPTPGVLDLSSLPPGLEPDI